MKLIKFPEHNVVYAENGKIWHRILTFGQPLQPQLLEIDKPFKRKEK